LINTFGRTKRRGTSSSTLVEISTLFLKGIKRDCEVRTTLNVKGKVRNNLTPSLRIRFHARTRIECKSNIDHGQTTKRGAPSGDWEVPWIVHSIMSRPYTSSSDSMVRGAQPPPQSQVIIRTGPLWIGLATLFVIPMCTCVFRQCTSVP